MMRCGEAPITSTRLRSRNQWSVCDRGCAL